MSTVELLLVLLPLSQSGKLTKLPTEEKLLSEASIVSLKLQGGLLSSKDARSFEKEEFFKDSIRLRKFDESAKKVGIKIKDIIDYKDLLKSSLK